MISMINAPYEKEFVFHDGSRAKNLLELASQINRLSHDEFFSFANTQKNDFANWIQYVLEDVVFANQLRAVQSKEQTVSLLNEKLVAHRVAEQQLNTVTAPHVSLSSVPPSVHVSSLASPPPALPPKPEVPLLEQKIAKKHKWFNFLKKKNIDAQQEVINHNMNQNMVHMNSQSSASTVSVTPVHTAPVHVAPVSSSTATTAVHNEHKLHTFLHHHLFRRHEGLVGKPSETVFEKEKTHEEQKPAHGTPHASAHSSSEHNPAEHILSEHHTAHATHESAHDAEHFWWVTLYGVLIGVIVILLIYQFIWR